VGFQLWSSRPTVPEDKLINWDLLYLCVHIETNSNHVALPEFILAHLVPLLYHITCILQWSMFIRSLIFQKCVTYVTYTLLTNQDQCQTMIKQRGFKASSDPWKQLVCPACMLGRAALAWVGDWGCFGCAVTPITQGWHRANHSKSMRCECVCGHCEEMGAHGQLYSWT